MNLNYQIKLVFKDFFRNLINYLVNIIKNNLINLIVNQVLITKKINKRVVKVKTVLDLKQVNFKHINLIFDVNYNKVENYLVVYFNNQKVNYVRIIVNVKNDFVNCYLEHYLLKLMIVYFVVVFVVIKKDY